MKKMIYQLCTKLAACAFLAAVVSVGTASHGGMYEPKVPKAIKNLDVLTFSGQEG